MLEIKDEIILRGLKENNLKNIDMNIPKEKGRIIFEGTPEELLYADTMTSKWLQEGRRAEGE